MKRENPWRTLRAAEGLELWWAYLPDEVGARWDGLTITLDPRLSRVERRCALMHELVHAERRIGWPSASALTMQREEALVHAEAVRRLVPRGDLQRFVARRLSVEPVTALVVAEEYDVTVEVAASALSSLASSS